MFHRVHDISQQFEKHKFEAYLTYLRENYTFCVPQDPLQLNTLNICLTFDDAYCDFYYYVYPLLKQYNLKAILGVSTDYIVDTTTIDKTTRLSVPYPKGMNSSIWQDKVPFCTWQELREMSESGHVIMASHSASHPHMTDSRCKLEREVIESKNIMQHKLDTPIDCFIYPYGDYNRSVHKLVRQHYRWDFRIGSASNRHWPSNNPLYRIDAEKFWPQTLPFTDKDLRKMNRKYWINRLRRK